MFKHQLQINFGNLAEPLSSPPRLKGGFSGGENPLSNMSASAGLGEGRQHC